MKDRCLIVDAYNLFVRHYVVHPAMSKNGEQIGGIVGFYNNLCNIVERCNPKDVYIIWEGGGSLRKRNIYPDYKRQSRPQKLNRYYDEIPDTLQNRNYQIKTLIDLLECFPITQLYVEDSEADDVIGYLCKYSFKHREKVILSSDHDYYQLVNELTIIWSPTLKKFVNKNIILERTGIHPDNFSLAKSICGDKSDNIPGIKGMGFKSLVKMFPKFGTNESYNCNSFCNDVAVCNKKSKKIIELSKKESRVLIKRNFKLIHLDVHNLAHYQINKINQKLEKNKNSYDSMKAFKLLNKNAINNLDILRSKIVFRNLTEKS